MLAIEMRLPLKHNSLTARPKRRAVITGLAGQDGSYLAELLLEKGYEVHGIVRRSAIESPGRRMGRISHLLDRVEVHSVPLDSYVDLAEWFGKVKPDECYHLATPSFANLSLNSELATLQESTTQSHCLLAAIKETAPRCRFFFAASGRIFEDATHAPQTEQTPLSPRSTYAVSKVVGLELTRDYRDTYDLHASAGIMYRHASPRRGQQYVTRKITSHAAQVKLGLADRMPLSHLDTRCDWGHARDYAHAMWLMLQQDKPDDYVIATGHVSAVRDFADAAFSYLGMDYRQFVSDDAGPRLSGSGAILAGDAAKARRVLEWSPTYSFEELVNEMVEDDFKLASQEAAQRLSVLGKIPVTPPQATTAPSQSRKPEEQESDQRRAA